MSTVTLTAEYVTQTHVGSWRVAGTRVSLESVIFLYLDGAGAEEIVRQFPTLNEEQVHGAIAFYLRNKAAMDAYLDHIRELFETGRQESEIRNATLLARLRAHRDQQQRGEPQ